MKFLTIQDAYQRKFDRQKSIKELKYHAGGHCVHIGKISPGCAACFLPNPYSYNLFTGAKCNLNCPYCFEDVSKELNKKTHYEIMSRIVSDSKLPGYNPIKVSFTGGGEPFLHPDIIEEYMGLFKQIELKIKKKPWFYIYTNGVLADSSMLIKMRDLGIDEIRFHLGASNFSKQVYQNIKKAVKLFKAVSIETPSWPLHRKKLFTMLPVINDLGVKHLNLGEIEVTLYNYATISKMLPRAEIYQCYMIHLYDQGLVYDIIEEVLRKKYVFSVLDCNCFVKSIQRSDGKWMHHQEIKGLCAKY